MNIKAITLGAVIALSGCAGAEAASVTTPSAPITTEATTTTVPPTTATTVAPTTTTVIPTTTVAALRVTSVVDGDTLDLSDGTVIRLIGIDTPERGQCGYDDATAVMAGLVPGFDITLMPGARDDVDKYGRLLRYVEANGIDVNLAMIESGRAIARYDGRDGYGEHTRQAAYVAADAASPSLNQCVAAVVPIAAPVANTPVTTTPAINAPATATPAPPTPPPAAVVYKNCAAVRAAGAAPIHAGDPGWQTKFDADGDGVGCE